MRGFIVDCNFLIRVSDLMECLHLPYPRKRNVIINDDETLPIITEGYWKC